MMQKCTDAAFCNRLLGTKDEGYIIDPASVHVAGAKLSAKVLNKENPNVKLTLTLTAYGSFLRMHVNEEDSSKGRFEVPGVLHKDLSQLESSWQESRVAAAYTLLKIGESNIVLKYSPLQLSIDIAGKPAMTFNSRQMFNFEYLRQKKVYWSRAAGTATSLSHPCYL